MTTDWFDVFTPQTWEEARAYGFTVSGFNEAKFGTVKKVQLGDVLICYLSGPTKLIGALRVTGDPYLSHEPKIWKGKNSFPARIPVEPLKALEIDQAINFKQLLPQLSFYDAGNMRSTWAHLQGSPKKLNDADGALLFAAIQAAEGEEATPTSTPISPPPGEEPPPVLYAAVQAEQMQPTLMPNPLDILVQQITAAQREAGKPAALEHAVAQAFQFLGFDVTLFGQSGKTDMVVDSPLGHDRFRATVDAKASGSGRIPESQINWPAVAGHRQQESADFAVVVGEKFAGGNLHKFAADFGVALVDTESLIEVMRLHAVTPFPAADLRPLFGTAGPVSSVAADLRQKSQTICRHWQLVAEIVRLVDDFSRLEQPPVPTSGNLHAVLVARALAAKDQSMGPPSEQDVRDALTFLSSRAIGILRPVEPEAAAYRLTMSRHAAARRLQACERTIGQMLDDKDLADMSHKSLNYAPTTGG